MRIKENLCSLRKKRKLTYKEVADFIGVSESLAEKWENGTEEPNIQQCLLLSKLYHVSLDDLLYGKIETKSFLSNKTFFIFSLFMLALGAGYFGKNLYDRLNDHPSELSQQEIIHPARGEENNLLEYDFEDGTSISISYKKDVDYISKIENPQYKWVDAALYLRMEPIIINPDEEVPGLIISVFDPPEGEVFMNRFEPMPEKIVVRIPEEKVEEIETLTIKIYDDLETIQNYYYIDAYEMAKIRESKP